MTGKTYLNSKNKLRKLGKKSYDDLKQRYDAVVDENGKLTRILKNGILESVTFQKHVDVLDTFKDLKTISWKIRSHPTDFFTCVCFFLH